MRYSIRTLLVATTLTALAIAAGRWLWAWAPETTESIGWGVVTMWGSLALNRLRCAWDLPGILPTILVPIAGVLAALLAFLHTATPAGVVAGWGAGAALYRYGTLLLNWVLLQSGVETDISR